MTKLRMMRIIAISSLNSFLYTRQKQEVFFVLNDIDTKEITTAKFIEIMKNTKNRKIVQIVPLLVYVIDLKSTNGPIYFPFYGI